MKVLLLAPQPFYSERGTPIAIHLAVTVLCAAGHEVDMITYHEGADVRFPGLRIMRIAKPPLVAGVPIGLSWKKLVCDVWLAAAAYRRLRLQPYDVVHAVEESIFPALLMRSMFRFRLVYDMDSLMFEQIVEKWTWLKPARRALSWFERTAVKRADRVLAVCPAVADYARAHGGAHKVDLVPDVAFSASTQPGLADVSTDTVDLRRLFDRDAPLALYVGNLEGYQGVDLLLGGLAALPQEVQCNLALVGGTEPSRQRYETLAAALGISARVRFTGPRPLAELPRLLCQADILCSPRATGSNTPMKIYSYLASGRAILATSIEAHTQVLDSRSAWLVPATPAAVAAGLSRLAADPALRRQLGENAANLARSCYSFEAFEHRLTSAYDKLAVHTIGSHHKQTERRPHDRCQGIRHRQEP